MAFTVVITKKDVSTVRRILGTYASDGGSTGGAIATGMKKVYAANFSCATATPSTVSVISGGTVTITTTANQTGTFEIVGI